MAYLSKENKLTPVPTRNGVDIDFSELTEKEESAILDLYNITLDLISIAPCLYHTQSGVEVCIIGEVGTFEISIDCCCSFREDVLKFLNLTTDSSYQVSAYPYAYEKNVASEQLKTDIDQYILDLQNRISEFDQKNDRHYTLPRHDQKDDD